MRHDFHSAIIWVLLLVSAGFGETYSFKPSVSRRKVNVLRAYDLALVPGEKNVVYLPAMMSFYGATNEQEIVSSEFKYSVEPDVIKITADERGMPRKYYQLTWNQADTAAVRVEQTMEVMLMCRNKLCTQVKYPYEAEVASTFDPYYLSSNEKEGILVEDPQLDSICGVIDQKCKYAEQAVMAVCDWINDNVDFQSKTDYSSDETLRKRKGNCTVMSKLACAMLRKLQIPCDIVSGKFIGGNSGHSYIEVYYPDAGWVFYDLSNRQRGFKIPNCLMTVGYSYRQEGSRKSEWVNGYFCSEKHLSNYQKPTQIRKKPIRNEPKTTDVYGVQVVRRPWPESVRTRHRPLRDLILDTSVEPGVRPYFPQ